MTNEDFSKVDMLFSLGECYREKAKKNIASYLMKPSLAAPPLIIYDDRSWLQKYKFGN